jgi:hypothetical protein
MTDGELLEQAAKAIGLKYIKPAEGYSGEFGLIAGIETLHSVTDRCGATTWNPLSDDGDALRLAVRLDLIVSRGCTEVGKEAVVFYLNEIQHQMRCVVPHGNNPYAATRLAIVRAAAEMGRAK